jgi:hypothetical protein
VSKVETYDFLEDLKFPTGEYYGRFGWSNCTDRQELLAKAKPNCIYQNYEALVMSGYPDLGLQKSKHLRPGLMNCKNRSSKPEAARLGR